jgi:hypothetical protein
MNEREGRAGKGERKGTRSASFSCVLHRHMLKFLILLFRSRDLRSDAMSNGQADSESLVIAFLGVDGYVAALRLG